MQRVRTAYDLLEALVIVAMLRDAGIEASVFDAEFVRQDWFRMLAYGGFRIMVPDRDAADAVRMLADYDAGAIAPAEAEDRLACPRCTAEAVREDPWPRRWTFLAIIVLSGVQTALLVADAPGTATLVSTIVALGIAAAALPGLLLRYKWAVRCDACAHRWVARPRRPFAELAHGAESAPTVVGAPAA